MYTITKHETTIVNGTLPIVKNSTIIYSGGNAGEGMEKIYIESSKLEEQGYKFIPSYPFSSNKLYKKNNNFFQFTMTEE